MIDHFFPEQVEKINTSMTAAKRQRVDECAIPEVQMFRGENPEAQGPEELVNGADDGDQIADVPDQN